jgi:LEA14-like dessication related protein
MTPNKTIFWLFGVATAYWLYQKFVFTQKVSFEIQNVDITGSFYNPLIIVTVLVTNPSTISTEISDINAELFLNESIKVANIQHWEPVSIAGVSKTPISLNIYPTLSNIITSLQTVLSTNTGNFKLVGTAKVDGINFPFNLKYQVL